MKIYSFKRSQKLNLDINEAWEYFSSPANLEEITPKEMSFEVISKLPEVMMPGLIISYYVRPILGIKLSWISEITYLKEPETFIDVQRFGPYKFWHHRHTFTKVDGGVVMEDLIHWGLPFGMLGRIFGAPIVTKKLNSIFDYREKVLDNKFNK